MHNTCTIYENARRGLLGGFSPKKNLRFKGPSNPFYAFWRGFLKLISEWYCYDFSVDHNIPPAGGWVGEGVPKKMLRIGEHLDAFSCILGWNGGNNRSIFSMMIMVSESRWAGRVTWVYN